MTSDVTHDKIVNFFEENSNFGVQGSDILFFKQGSLPTLDFDGKFQFESKTSISMGPNGNGALFQAMRENEDLMNSIDSSGIQYIHVVGVDNVLCKLLDPLYVGFTIQKELKVAAKVIGKISPYEPMGVFAQ